MQPGDYIAATGMAIVLGLLIYGHLSAIRAQRRAQRELDKRLGHPARWNLPTRDPRVTEQPRR